MDSGTSRFPHHVLLRVYLSLGVEIIGTITRWDYLFLERGTRNGARNFTWMHPRDAQRGCGSRGLLEPCSPFLRAARLLEGLVSLAHRLPFSATACRPSPSVGSRPAVVGSSAHEQA